ncbi:FAD-dependent oxidoreductase [Streptomyces iconiensis]|uniref:ferredoxin--NADP(+) reductase n=1 Tax=Streptomyces iconiensis TaxID=1384038 RepID=A0ABT7A8E0_9ACTN|nr:FAD-dependent oxidoreductase [Streptomyces iconiensis]MDJ1137259.1 FAD-dependent oxidoreductase [Streptomyces iconiensis]
MPADPPPPSPLRVAVVGAGPSGVYAAQGLVKDEGATPAITVDVLDRLPCPYGLVRYGVAPDHEKIKSLQNSLRTVLEHPRIRFLGNVEVGPGGIRPDELLGMYHAVVYCVGAATDRRLGIPGEELRGSYSATDFVSWYSAHPDAAGGEFALGARSAVVIGVGNVAVDVARVLVRGVEELRHTDIPQGALDSLERSTVSEVSMVGRRGPSQAKFTTKELRELGTLPGVGVSVRTDELALDPGCEDPASLPTAVRRNVTVLRDWAESAADGDAESRREEPQEEPRDARGIQLRFFLRPSEILDDGTGGVRAVRFERTAPDGGGGVTGTGRYEDIEAQLVLRSVGYHGVPLAGLPFDERSGTVPHAAGRVLREGAPSPGEYVAGWIKRGPTGVIGTNRPCAKETVGSLLADAGALLEARGPLPDDPLEALRAAGRVPVAWPGWLGIESAEAELGRSLERGTVKIPDWEGLLSAARLPA